MTRRALSVGGCSIVILTLLTAVAVCAWVGIVYILHWVLM